jgi:hypothetical protein
VKLLCFYVNDGSLDESAFLGLVAAALPQGAHGGWVHGSAIPCTGFTFSRARLLRTGCSIIRRSVFWPVSLIS